MQITLTPDQAQVLRSIGAKINGAFGGAARTKKKTRAARRNVKQATKTRLEAAHAV